MHLYSNRMDLVKRRLIKSKNSGRSARDHHIRFGGLFLWVIANTLGLGKEFVIYPLILAIPNAIIVGVISFRKARRIYSFPEEDRSLVSGKQ